MNGINRPAFEAKRKLHSDDKVPYSKGREFMVSKGAKRALTA